MKTTQVLTDKFSIGISFLCAIHCLLLPFLLVAIPSLGSIPLQDEDFHKWMILAVVPVSMYALTLGCKEHRQHLLLYRGTLGLTLMILATLIGHETLGEIGEKLLTLVGSAIVISAHWENFNRCQLKKNCSK